MTPNLHMAAVAPPCTGDVHEFAIENRTHPATAGGIVGTTWVYHCTCARWVATLAEGQAPTFAEVA